MDVKVKVVDKAGKVYSMAVVLYYEKGKSKESFNVQKASRSIADAAGIVNLKVDSAKNYFFRNNIFIKYFIDSYPKRIVIKNFIF